MEEVDDYIKLMPGPEYRKYCDVWCVYQILYKSVFRRNFAQITAKDPDPIKLFLLLMRWSKRIYAQHKDLLDAIHKITRDPDEWCVYGGLVLEYMRKTADGIAPLQE